MIVCICKNISDSQIKQSVRNGAKSLHQVRQDIDLAGQCCKCLPDARSIINQELELIESRQQNTDNTTAFGIFSPV